VVSTSDKIKNNFIFTFLASAFLLETFFGFEAVVVFLVVAVFLEETLGMAVFLIMGFETAFPLGFLGAEVFLALSAVSLEVVFFTGFAVVLLDFSLVEDGFLVVVVLFLVEGGFLF